MKKAITLLALILLVGVVSSFRSYTSNKTTKQTKSKEIVKKYISNKNYTIKIKESPDIQILKNYTTTSDNFNRISINAERINLKDLFTFILKAAPDDIIIENKERLKEYYEVVVRLKQNINNTKQERIEALRKEIVNELLIAFDLSLEKVRIRTINIQDTVKLNKFTNYCKSGTSKVSWSNDTVKVENISLKELAKLLDSKFLISNNDSVRISYQWSNIDADLIKKLENDLGLSFNNTKTESYKYILKDNF